MLRISSSSSSLHVPSICGAPVSFILSFLNPSSRKVSNFTRLALLHSTTLFPNSRNFQFPTFRRVSTMMGRTHSCSRVVTASYSAASGPGGSSGGDREILVQHLLVKEDDQKLLLDLQKKTAEGEDLSDLAVEYSMCPSKEDGGMLGWVRKGQMVPEFEEAAFGAPLNKVVKCKTKFGWHLLQVLSEREESVLEHIQPNEFHVRLQDPSFLEEAQLIDVREPEEVAQASVPGFQILPLRQFGVWGPEITTKFDPQKDTYVLCHHGVRSLQVAKWLQTQRNGPRKVPQFGAWDNNGGDGGNAGYTVEFSKARANKQHQPKNGLDVRHELKNDKELNHHHEHKQSLDTRHGLKNDKEIQHHEHKQGLDARHGHGLKNNNKDIQNHEYKHGLDAHHGYGMKNNNKEIQHHENKHGLDAHHGHGLKNNNKEIQHHENKHGVDAHHGHGLKNNNKEIQHHENKHGSEAHHGHGLKNNNKEIQHHEHKHGSDAHHSHGLKNNNKEIQHHEHKHGLDTRHGLKNDKEPMHQQHKNGLRTRHGLENNQEFQHQPYKNGLGPRHGLTNDQEFPGKKQEDPNMKNGYRSVPQFGMWDQQATGGGAAASYTVEFSKARVNRKQHKNNDLLARPPSIDHEQEDLRKQQEDACMRKKNMLTYLNCCIRP